VLEHALTAVPAAIEWTEADDLASQPGHLANPPGTGTTAH
jgi:ATP-dependent Lon protease